MIYWQQHLLVVGTCVIIGLTNVDSQKIIGLFQTVQPPEEVSSTIGNDPPVYLAAPISVRDSNNCGSMDYRNYKKLSFEGFVNFAKILTKERQRGNIVLTVDVVNTSQVQLCNMEYNDVNGAAVCVVKSSTNATCSCAGVEGLMLRVFFSVGYKDGYVNYTYFNLHWVNTHTLSSADRKFELESYGNFYAICNWMPKDHLRRLPMIPLHTIADDPPIFIAEPHVMLLPNVSRVNADNPTFFDKIFIEAYVNMAKMSYNTRTFETQIILTCQAEATIKDLCVIRYDGKYKNSTWTQGDTLHDLKCGVESYVDMKLRVFYEMNHMADLLPCYFSVHLVSYFTISTRYKTIGTAVYASKLKR